MAKKFVWVVDVWFDNGQRIDTLAYNNERAAKAAVTRIANEWKDARFDDIWQDETATAYDVYYPVTYCYREKDDSRVEIHLLKVNLR